MIKIWTYKSKRSFKEIGIVVKIELIYFKIPSRYIEPGKGRNRKRKKLKENWIKTFNSFTYFPSDLCKPRHYLEVDQIYVHEIFRLLERLR